MVGVTLLLSVQYPGINGFDWYPIAGSEGGPEEKQCVLQHAIKVVSKTAFLRDRPTLLVKKKEEGS
jgi:hypothetical protein